MKAKGYAAIVLFCGLVSLALGAQLVSSAFAVAQSRSPASLPQAPSQPAVTLRAATGATIPFQTQNGRTMGDVPPQTLDLPHLVLQHNGALTDPAERRLIVEVTGIEVVPPGVTVTLAVETSHGDPDQGSDTSNRILLWRESLWIANGSGTTRSGGTAVFAHEFGRTVTLDGETIATPTDYFRCEVTVSGHPPRHPPAGHVERRIRVSDGESVGHPAAGSAGRVRRCGPRRIGRLHL